MPASLCNAAVQAGLIICYAGTGRTASLVAKYRPNVPILTLVVPQLKSKGLAWELEGRSLARQFLIMRGAHLKSSSPRPAKIQHSLSRSPCPWVLDLQGASPTGAAVQHPESARLVLGPTFRNMCDLAYVMDSSTKAQTRTHASKAYHRRSPSELLLLRVWYGH